MIKLISKFALLILIMAVLYLLISGNLLSQSPFVIAAQLLAVALSVWARRSFQAGKFNIHAEPEAEHLLMTGPYKFIRHPMYSSALLLVWSGILGHISPVTVVIGVFISIVIAIRIVIEEKLLSNQYPDYGNYAIRTKRIVPFLI